MLITSGGTKTSIDEVRHIGNMSQGTFGTHMCMAALKAGHQVDFLYAKGSKAPHIFTMDLRDKDSEVYQPWCNYRSSLEAVKELVKRIEFMQEAGNRYRAWEYNDFDSYAKELEGLSNPAKGGGYHAVTILAAAVSDFAPVKTEGKISSEAKTMDIHCVQTEKLIRRIKEWNPDTFLVGFKLLVGSTQEQLELAMVDQMHKAKCDMVIGNDLREIRAAKHKVTTLSIDGYLYESDPGTTQGYELAEKLIKDICQDVVTLTGVKASQRAQAVFEAERLAKQAAEGTQPQ